MATRDRWLTCNGLLGGEGVAASVGQCLATFSADSPVDLAVAAATVSRTRRKRRAFTATAVSSVRLVAGEAVWWSRGWRKACGPRPTVALSLAAASAVILDRLVDSPAAHAAPLHDATSSATQAGSVIAGGRT